jgi:hypothetical protein
MENAAMPAVDMAVPLEGGRARGEELGRGALMLRQAAGDAWQNTGVTRVNASSIAHANHQIVTLLKGRDN